MGVSLSPVPPTQHLCACSGRPAPVRQQKPVHRRTSVLLRSNGSSSGGGSGGEAPEQRQQQPGASSSSASSSGEQQQQTSAGTPPVTDPAQMVVWGGNLPSPRRLVLGGLGATTVALVSNLGGLTSGLLSLDGGGSARTARLDVLYPVKGFKRCLDLQNGYEFLYPAAWLADQTLAYRAAQRAEQRYSLDLPAPSAPRRRKEVAEPSAAFGPAGSTGEENVSVIVAPIRPGFTLRSMGDPQQLGRSFLSNIAAPEGSGLSAELLRAEERVVGGELYYELEYTVQGPRFRRHNVSVTAARNDLLYTLNCQCPEDRWGRDGGLLRTAAASFRLVNSGAATAGFPDRL